MKNKQLLFISGLCLLTLSLSQCKGKKSETKDTTAEVAAIRKADSLWSVAAGQKQMDNFMSYVADGCAMLPPNAPVANTPEAIKAMMNQFFNIPGYGLKWQASKIEVAGSGDLGYSMGAYELSMNDPQGKPMTEKGKYTTIWKKQTDGSWKVEVDQFNSDLPAAPSPQK